VESLCAQLLLVQPGEAVVETLDEISEAVCGCVDAAELCRHTHPDAEWRAEAEGACVRLHALVGALNGHGGLYAALCGAQAACAAGTAPPLSEEGARVAASLRAEFERGGIHLRAEQRDALEAAQARAVAAGHAFVRGASQASGGGPHLLALLRARAEAAALLGFPSFAALATQPLLAGSPAAPAALCTQLATDLAPRSAAELAGLGRGCSVLDADTRELLMAARRAELCPPAMQAAAARFFPLPAVVSGLRLLAERLFGVTLRAVPLRHGEAWAGGVTRLEASHANDGDIGTVYLDLAPRPGKLRGAAHFVLRAGRTRGQGVLPAVALVASCGGGGGGVSHSSVELLHHEFGHALHSLLSRTRYQHLSGTRGAADCVEVPSMLLERGAWQHSWLAAWARDPATGEPLPRELLRQIVAARDAFRATDALQAVLHSASDLALHGATADGLRAPAQLRALLAAEQLRLAPSLPQPRGWEAHFTHFVGYGGTYYAYLYGRAFSGTAWRRLALGAGGNLPPPGAAEPFSRHLLRPGGVAEPHDALTRLLGAAALQRVGRGWAPCAQQALVDIMSDSGDSGNVA
jgi:intermediate peptidase